MLSEELIERLNRQINLEHYSANVYLQMSSWCESKGLEGSAAFLKKHAAEEMSHMHRLFSYVNETGAMVTIDAIEAPNSDFQTIADVFRAALEHECVVTERINALVDHALGEKDYSTFNFLQWYVAEQHEEEHLFKSILDKIEIIGIEGHGLFLIDKEIGNMARG
jgi:ferritin